MIMFAPHICMVLFFTHIPFVVNHTINATPPERLQHDQVVRYECQSLRNVLTIAISFSPRESSITTLRICGTSLKIRRGRRHRNTIRDWLAGPAQTVSIKSMQKIRINVSFEYNHPIAEAHTNWGRSNDMRSKRDNSSVAPSVDELWPSVSWC